ncbi:MAG: branched-chain amino acid ABC transporter permease [Acidimicrobiales bacterium]
MRAATLSGTPDTRPAASRGSISGRKAAGYACLAAFIAVFGLVANSYYLNIGDLCLLAMIGAIGLNLLTGYAGQVSVGSAPLLAIGAFTAAGTVHVAGFVVSVLAGGLAASLAGLVVGFPSLRLRGLYLVFSTLALLVVVQFAFQELQVDTGALAGWSFAVPTVATLQVGSLKAWYLVLAIAVLLTASASLGITGGKLGRAWQAVKGHDVAASVMGIDVTREKLRAFVVSSFIIGCAGALGAFFVGQVSYDSYGLELSVSYIAMIIVGGLGSIVGSMIGAVVVTALPFVISSVGASVSVDSSGSNFIQTNLASIETGVYAAIVIAFLMFEPTGIAGLASRFSALVGSRRSLASPSSGEPFGSTGDPLAGGEAPVVTTDGSLK